MIHAEINGLLSKADETFFKNALTKKHVRSTYFWIVTKWFVSTDIIIVNTDASTDIITVNTDASKDHATQFDANATLFLQLHFSSLMLILSLMMSHHIEDSIY